MQHTSKFQLIETITYLFLSIYLDKVTISVISKLTYANASLKIYYQNFNTYIYSPMVFP